MVKNKRELKSPKRKSSLTGPRTSTRLRQNVSNTGPAGNINVVIRVRPLHEREISYNNRSVIEILNEQTIVFDPKEEDDPFFYHGVQQTNRDIMKRANKNLNFTFNHVFGEDSTNKIIFEATTKPLIETLLKGYNCSVFVYGATGAGKTHTMLGREQDPGITFLTLMELFKQKEASQNEREFEIGMTYLEVYNETVQDLLNPGTPLMLREDGKYGVVVAGIKMHRIEESNVLFELLEQGNRNRTQHPTDANTESSRSHAVFQVYLRMKSKATNEINMSKLSMIDLAGSERGAATGYSGARFTEGANINKSLLALGNCINSLADGRRHIPYRDSKLTRLLKDSLGGNCRTVMIANVSPSAFNYEDTYNTLKYAMRAKKIKAAMKKNVVSSESSLNHYMQLVEQLTKEKEEWTKEKEELQLQLALYEKECHCKAAPVQPAKMEEINPALENTKENLQLQTDLQKLYDEKKQLEHRMSQLESAKQLATLRKQLKQETNSRISEVCADIAEKNQCRTRLVNAVDRLDRQTSTIQEDITQLEQNNILIETQIQEILCKNPQLTVNCDIQNAEIMYIKVKNKVDHFQKVTDFQAGELRLRSQMIQCFSEVLQPCFLQLRGHGLATESLTTKYQKLIRNLQGMRSVSWDDDSVEPDSGTSSTTVEQKDSIPTPKRKMSKSLNLDGTFVVAENEASEKNERVFEIQSDRDDEIVMDATYGISADSENELEDEVFTNSETPKTKTKVVQSTGHNVCAEDMMFRVNKPNTPDTRIPPLASRNRLQTSSKTVTAKRLLTNVKPQHVQKENQKPRSQYGTTKFLDRYKLKPSSARSNPSTSSSRSHKT